MRLVDYNTPFCKSNNTHAISSKKIFFSAISIFESVSSMPFISKKELGNNQR